MSAAKKLKLDHREAPAADPTSIHGASPPPPPPNAASFGSLSADMLDIILGYLSWDEILNARVCRALRESAVRTLVPFSATRLRVENAHGTRFPEYLVCSLRRFEALAWMRRALPNLQQICFHKAIVRELAFEDGEDPIPDPSAARRLARGLPSRQIDIIANFPKLRRLGMDGIQLNGSYPCLLGFPHLQQLEIRDVTGLKLDLETIASSFPVLEKLDLHKLPYLRGDIRSLRVLKDRLRDIGISSCPLVHGSLLDLADFPLLRELWLVKVDVSGDVRQIGEEDFSSLTELRLPESVYGAKDRPLERIADATEVMDAICRLKRRTGACIDLDGQLFGLRSLARDSPDRYPKDELSSLVPPIWVETVAVDECVGWRWTNTSGQCCRTNWIGQAPGRESSSSDYERYRTNVEASPFKDFVNPPTEAEYRNISSRYPASDVDSDSDSDVDWDSGTWDSDE